MIAKVIRYVDELKRRVDERAIDAKGLASCGLDSCLAIIKNLYYSLKVGMRNIVNRA